MNFQLIIYLCLVLSKDVLSKSLRIIGGKEADIKDFPFMVSLRYDTNQKFFCSGSIISNRHILTAGHCVDGLLQSKFTIYLGTNNLDDHGIEYEVRQIDFHPKYAWEEDVGSKVQHDIAVIMVSPYIEFNEFQNKIELATTDTVDGDNATIVGWGWTMYPDGDINLKLHTQQTKVMSNSKCEPKFPLFLHDHQVCTLADEGIGSCYGDSGGPLIVDGKLAGISSLIEPCATRTPDVFTRVHVYLDFIKKSMEQSLKYFSYFKKY